MTFRTSRSFEVVYKLFCKFHQSNAMLNRLRRQQLLNNNLRWHIDRYWLHRSYSWLQHMACVIFLTFDGFIERHSFGMTSFAFSKGTIMTLAIFPKVYHPTLITLINSHTDLFCFRLMF